MKTLRSQRCYSGINSLGPSDATIGSDNGLSPGRRQAIIWTYAGILLIGPLGTNFNEILIEIHTFSFRKMHLKTSSGKWQPFCLGLNVLTSKQLGYRPFYQALPLFTDTLLVKLSYFFSVEVASVYKHFANNVNLKLLWTAFFLFIFLNTSSPVLIGVNKALI